MLVYFEQMKDCEKSALLDRGWPNMGGYNCIFSPIVKIHFTKSIINSKAKYKFMLQKEENILFRMKETGMNFKGQRYKRFWSSS